MVFGLSIGGKKEKTRFNETFDETEDYNRGGLNMPLVPEAWQGRYDTTYDLVTGGGPGAQQEGTNRLRGLTLDLGGAQDALTGARGDLDQVNQDYVRAYMDRGSNTLGAFFGRRPETWCPHH